jgi:DNA processing protein
VIVVEANAKSGALITATHAGEQGREVFAVPGAADSPASAGCLDLLRKGARLIRNADDVLEDLKGISTADYRQPANPERERRGDSPTHPVADTPGSPEPAPPPPPLPTLDPTQQRVYDALDAKRHADELVRQLSLSAGDLSRTLMQLELKKIIRRLPGNFYERR